jgi:hypothetical protein
MREAHVKAHSLLIILPLACGGPGPEAVQSTELVGGATELPEGGTGSVRIVCLRETNRFTTLDDMVAGSDVVVEGVVQSVVPGELRGVEANGGGGIRFSEATIAVTRVLAGAVEGRTLVIESMAATGDGRPYTFQDGSHHHLHVPEETAIFHLVKTRRDDARVLYRLASSQGKFVYDREGKLTATRKDDALAHELEHIGLFYYRARVEHIARARAVGRKD